MSEAWKSWQGNTHPENPSPQFAPSFRSSAVPQFRSSAVPQFRSSAVPQFRLAQAARNDSAGKSNLPIWFLNGVAAEVTRLKLAGDRSLLTSAATVLRESPPFTARRDIGGSAPSRLPFCPATRVPRLGDVSFGPATACPPGAVSFPTPATPCPSQTTPCFTLPRRCSSATTPRSVQPRRVRPKRPSGWPGHTVAGRKYNTIRLKTHGNGHFSPKQQPQTSTDT